MDDSSIQVQKDEIEIQKTKSELFFDELEDKTTMQGFDAYVGGETKNRITRSIERLQRHTRLSDEQIDILKNSVTEEPRFGTEEGAEFTQLMTKAQKKKLGYFKKKRYNKKEAAYKRQLGDWEFKNLNRIYNQENKVYMAFRDAEKAGREVGKDILSDAKLEAYSNLISEDQIMDNRIAEEKKKKAKAKEETVTDVEAIVNEMDKMFIDHTNAENMAELENQQAAEDGEKIKKAGIGSVVNRYTNEGFAKYNSIFRQDGKEDTDQIDKMEAEKLKNGLKKCKNKETFVVNRGVSNLNALYSMLGIESPFKKVTEDNAEEVAQDVLNKMNDMQSKNKEVILSDPGFVSTGTNAQNSFASLRNIDYGIEFVIKVNKGTSCASVRNFSHFPKENEMLLNAGTKFRLIKVCSCGKVQYDGVDYREPSYLTVNKNKYTEADLPDVAIKVYLETIPDSEEGVMKKK